MDALLWCSDNKQNGYEKNPKTKTNLIQTATSPQKITCSCVMSTPTT